MAGRDASTAVHADARPWWLQPQVQLLKTLQASATGLTSAQAHARLRRFGRNVVDDQPEQSPLAQFLHRFTNPLILILIAASVIAALSDEVASFIIIVVMVLMSVTLDFAQEYHAGRVARRLRQSVRVRARVLRDGAPKDVPATHVVPGDVVLLQAGNLVPADGLLLDLRNLFVNQALLTGESFPAEKRCGPVAGDRSDLSTATNALFMGTSVISGTARLVVCRTGAGTVLGEIAHTLSLAPPPTAFELGMRRFGMLIMRITVLMVLFVLMVNAATHKPLLESFLFAIALAVGLTPELLPMVVSVTLSRGAMRMARAHVIVKRLAAIQNLGAMDVLCTDKTGTLTEGTVRLEEHVLATGENAERVLLLGQVNSCFESGLRSPLDDALLAHVHLDAGAWTKIDEAPFDFERRRISVLVDDGTTRLLIVKGAPEEILRLSTHYEADAAGTVWVLDVPARARAQGTLDSLGARGLRTLGIASKRVAPDHDHATAGDESALVFAGFAAFLDPPKASAAQALDALVASGVAVKLVTGDDEAVTRHICARLEIPVTGMLTGTAIGELDDHALAARVEGVNLFCRVSPAQKNRIVIALRNRGRVVGYLGDGVNDAPALHSADVGLSVATAVDVAREAADLILLKQDLRVLHDGVMEGRRTFANIRKYIMMGTSSNFGNMFSMAAAALFLPFLPMLPTQILLNNVLYDVSEIAIPLDRVDDDEIARPQRWDIAFIRNFMWTFGPLSSLFDLATFYVLLVVLHADATLFQTGWFVESLATQVLVIFVIRTRGSALRSRPAAALVATSLAVVLAALWLPATALGGYFGFRAPPAEFYGILVGLILGYLVIVEAAKRIFFAARSQGAR
jgi:Mg2+-importing ATPase